MSGGSWDYFYEKLEDVARRLESDPNLHRVALGKLLTKAAVAMQAIEWVDSCDSAPGDEIPAILEVVTRGEVMAAASDRLAALIKYGNDLLATYGDVATSAPEQT